MIPKHRKVLLSLVATFLLLSLLAAANFYVVSDSSSPSSNQLNLANQLRAAVPFTFLSPFDPKQITSVGNQMLAEHVFAFHLRSSFKLGDVPVFSEVRIDRNQAIMTISPIRRFLNAEGEELPSQAICDSIRSAFLHSQHVPYKSLVLSVSCADKDILVKLSKVPNNLSYLIKLPEFAIYDPQKIPLNTQEIDRAAFTGPFAIKAFSSSKVVLTPNHFYPQDLVADNFESVSFETYDSESTESFVEELVSRGNFDLAYLFGHSITAKAQHRYESSEYNYEYSPNEWFVYVGFLPGTSHEDRQIIADVIDDARTELLRAAPLGQEAFSIAPSDRPFGLNRVSYYEVAAANSKRKKKLSGPLVLGTLEGWAKSPIFDATIKAITRAHPEIELRLFPRSQMNDLYSGKVDLYLSPLGISKGDPLNHLSFLLEGDPIMSTITAKEELSQIAAEVSGDRFAFLVREIESRIVRERVLVPIGHFPGVVLSSKRLVRDESLAGNWGIQAWSYRKR